MKSIKRMALTFGTFLLFGSAIAAYAADDSTSESAPPSSQSTAFLPNKAGTFPANVSVNGISLEGMTLEEANAAVSEEVNSLLGRPMHMTYSGQTLDLPLSDIGISWANPDVVNELDSYVSRGNFIVRYKAMKELEQGPVEKTVELTGDLEQVKASISPSLDAATIQAQNASVTRANGQFVVTESKTGISYDVDTAATEILNQALNQNIETISYEVAEIITEPSIKTEVFQNFTNTPLGSCTTAFLASDTARADNVRKSVSSMNGRVFMPGEEISALAMYGEVTAENGYNMADTYENGTVKKGIGGGICQTTSSLYNAVLWSELQVTHRRQHSMAVDYLPPSMDAMVDYPSGSDFTFINSTENPIYIEAFCSGIGADGYDRLTINIYGTETRPANRTVNYRSEVLEWDYPGTLFDFVVDDTMKLGQGSYAEKQQTVTNVHPHIKSQLYKDVYVDGQLTESTMLHQDEYDFSTGVIRHASDVTVSVEVDKKTGRSVVVTVKFLDGSPVTG